MQSSDDNGALSISESNDDSPKMDNVKELVLFGGPLGINLKSCLGNQGAYIDSFYKTAYAGVNVGDLLCSINEKDVRTMRIEEIRWLIKNSKQPISLKFQSVFDYWPKNTAEGSNLPIETIKLILDQRFRSWTKRLLKEYALQQQSVDGTLPVTSSESNPTLMEKWKYFVLLHDSITTLSAFDHLECRSADVNAIKELLNFVTHLENKCNFVEDSDLEQMQKEELQFNKTGDDRSTFLEFRLQLEGIYKQLKMNLELELSQIPLSNVTCTKLMAYFYRQPQFHFISIDNILASNTCRIFLYLYLLALLPSNQSTIASTNANTGSNDIRFVDINQSNYFL